MLVCWEWLAQYVDLSVDADSMATKFAMSGLNHEWTKHVAADVVMDLEVTSNRGDCLGHIGVAREAAVLLSKPLQVPQPNPTCCATTAESLLKIENVFPEACPQYTARIIRGVRVGPSPAWLVRRLAAIGINSVNNVVDVTNYVMMECGQPLHAFDLAHVRGGIIKIRQASDKEKFLAIDHRTYELDAKMVVIADAERAVALGGVMGGAESEVSNSTRDLLIEAATFAPMSIRRAARKLKLESPSSHRFERKPDPAGLEWASLRCCQLIQEIAGGEVCSGAVTAGQAPEPREPIAFRQAQIERILGIAIPVATVEQILSALGCRVTVSSAAILHVVPPSWRADLTREIDLIEEVARIYGYDQISEDVVVPLGVASPRPRDITLGRVRHVLSACGIDEAMTPSVVNEQLESCGSVWTDQPPLATDTPLLVGSRLLRRSLLPSLLAARHWNQSQSIRNAQLYEVANIYLPSTVAGGLPEEQTTLGIVTAGDLRIAKGAVEELLAQVLAPHAKPQWSVQNHPFFAEGAALQVTLDGLLLGWVGIVNKKIQAALSLDQACAAAELSLDRLTDGLLEVRRADPVSTFPAINRDLNFVIDEPRTWSELSSLCYAEGGEQLRDVSYQETYRDVKKDGAGKKRVLLTLQFQSLTRTLTGDEVDASVSRIVAACQTQFGAHLLS